MKFRNLILTSILIASFNAHATMNCTGYAPEKPSDTSEILNVKIDFTQVHLQYPNKSSMWTYYDVGYRNISPAGFEVRASNHRDESVAHLTTLEIVRGRRWKKSYNVAKAYGHTLEKVVHGEGAKGGKTVYALSCKNE